MLAILNFLKDVNFTDQTVCRPGIQLDFDVFSINSHKTSSTSLNNLKLGTITPTQLANIKKVEEITFSPDISKNMQKLVQNFPFLELELKTANILSLNLET